MPDLDIAGFVTRDELSLADLDLNTDTYKIIRGGWGPGGVVWRRQTVQSPFSSGRYLTGRQKDQAVAPLAIRVTGTNEADCLGKVATLVAAFEQFEYQLSMTVETVTYTWNCECADWTFGEGGALQTFHLRAYKQEVVFEIPRHPVPVAGPF